MRKLKIVRILASALITVSVALALSPIGVSAEWRQTNSGDWWYADQYGGWQIDWKQIDKKWYYFYGENGLMARDTTIHTFVGDFKLGSDGAWIDIDSNQRYGVLPPLSPTVFNIDFKKGQIDYYRENAKYIIIPSEVEGVKITRIASAAFSNNPNTASVIIPEGVTYIGDSAFRNCEGLEKVVVPNSILSVGASLFNESVNAKFYVKSERVKILLVSASVPETNVIVTENNDENDKGNINISAVDNSVSDDDFSFDKTNGKILRYIGTASKLTIPNSIDGVTVKSIGDSAFYNCSILTDVKIPNGITSIENSAFSYCSNLTNITIPNGVTSIGHGAFSDCSNLTNITIPDGVTSIGNGAFSDCSNLTNITIPDGIANIGSNSFWQCKSLKSITVPDSVKSIGWRAFLGCDSLTDINANEKNTNSIEVSISGIYPVLEHEIM